MNDFDMKTEIRETPLIEVQNLKQYFNINMGLLKSKPLKAVDGVSFTIEEGALVAGEVKGSKTEQGESYTMPAGSWVKQAAAFSNSTVGKTVAELENLETVSDALAAAGCTMQNTTAGYKATIIKAVGYAK